MAAAWMLAEIPLLVCLAGEGARPVELVGIAMATLVATAVHRYMPSVAAALAWFAALVIGSSLVGFRGGLAAVLLALCWCVVLGVVRLSKVERGTFRPVIGPLVVAGVLGLFGTLGWLLVAAFVATALAVATRMAPRAASRVVAFGDRVGGVAGTVLGAVAMAPATVVVTVLWMLYRLVRHDPLGARSLDVPQWLPRESRAGARPERSFDPHAVVMPRAERWRRRLAHATALVAVVALAGWIAIRPPEAPQSEVFANDPEWPEVWAQQRKFNADPRFDNTTLWRLNDFRSPYVNQVDGSRHTWAPPPCQCRRYTVWWFGGSAAWGFYQRDEDTIPSQLARQAWQTGVALDIVNLAVPGYSSAQEVQLFAQMSTTEPLPDLVVFYDGANDLFLQVERNNRGQGSDESPASYAEQELSTFVSAASSVERLLTSGAAGVHLANDPAERSLDAPEVARHAMARYGRQIELGRRLAEAAVVPVLFVWQPLMSEAPLEAADEFEAMAPPDAAWHRRLTGSARALLPPEVLDLSDSLDAVTAPVFPDWAHTNEVGSRIVASGLLESISESGVLAGEP